MSTGLETWNQNIAESIGPLYPWAGGIEIPLAIIGIGTWIAWHLVQWIWENRSYDVDETSILNTHEKMEEALQLSETGTIVQSVAGKEPHLRHFAHNGTESHTQPKPATGE